MENKNNRGWIVAAILILVAIGIGGFIAYDHFFDNNNGNGYEPELTNQNEGLETGQFTAEETGENYDFNAFGSTQVRGYFLALEEQSPNFNYVIFNVIGSGNLDLIRLGRIELGCYINSQIEGHTLNYDLHENEEYDFTNINRVSEFRLSANDTTSIMNSTLENPIILELEIPKIGGSFSPAACFSWVRTNVVS